MCGPYHSGLIMKLIYFKFQGSEIVQVLPEALEQALAMAYGHMFIFVKFVWYDH